MQATRHFRSPSRLHRATHFKIVFGHCLCNNKMARDIHTTEIEIVHRTKKKSVLAYMGKIYIYMTDKKMKFRIFNLY